MFRKVLFKALLATAVALDDADCLDGSCTADDTQVLLQSGAKIVGEKARIIETVDDIDMEAIGLLPEHLDKENTLILEGVPILNFGQTYEGGMNPSLIELSEQKEWIIDFPETASDGDLKRFCNRKLAGNAQCDGEGHPSEGGTPIVVFKGTKAELQAALKGFHPKPAFAESDQPVSVIPEVGDKDLSFEEQEAVRLLEVEGTPHSWGLDRIDDAQGLDNDYQLPASSSQGAGAHVYIADTGIRTTHNEFEGRAYPSHEALGYSLKVCKESDTNCAYDRNGHGTHCAGTVGGKKYGVAKKTKLYAAKVLGDNGSGSFSGMLRSLDWVITYGQKPAIYSASLGGRGVLRSIEPAFKRALQAGVVVSVAAGNSRGDACGYSPAYAKSALTVGATSRPSGSQDPRAGFSNYGSCVDIFAPGVYIPSASHTSDTGVRSLSGTSMACPHVSGAAALLLGDGIKAQDVMSHMKKHGVSGTIRDARASPNLMLHVGKDNKQGTEAPTTEAPTEAPTQAPTEPPTTTEAPTEAPTPAPAPTTTTAAPTPAPTPTTTEAPATTTTTTAAPRPSPSPSPSPSLSEQIQALAVETKANLDALDAKFKQGSSDINAKLSSLEDKVNKIKSLLSKKPPYNKYGK